MPTAEFVSHKQTPEEFFRSYLPSIHPDLARRTEDIEFVEEVHVIPNYSYQVRGFCGKGFICLGDARRFIDPIFSFGLSATMREAEFAVPHIVSYLKGERRAEANPFDGFQRFVEKGTDNLEDMVDLFWEQPFAFATFVHQRYREQLIDAFAGRVYESETSAVPRDPAVSQIAEAGAGLRPSRRLFHSDRIALPPGASRDLGAQFARR